MPTVGRSSRNPPTLVAAFDLKQYAAPKGYVRVSTDEQAEEGTSIAVQIQQLKSYAAAFGHSLADADIYVDDGWSGKDLERPAMRQLRADAQSGKADCILVTKLDRFSRSLRDTVNLCLGEWQDEAPAGRQVVLKSISEPFDTYTDFGRMVFGLLAMFAEFERRRIADRTWSGKASRAEAGRNAGHRPPYGFRLSPASDGKGSCFEVVPAEAAIIRKICDLYTHGFGDQQIAHRLNEEGLRFRTSGLWQSQNVTRILTNPLIAGRYAYGKKTTDSNGSTHRLPQSQWVYSKEPAVTDPIIAPDLYDRMQAIRSSRRSGGRGAASTHLLSGLVRCGQCGSACAVKHSGPGGRYPYYACLRKKQSGTKACNQPQIRADLLDQQVLAAVRALLAASADALLERVAAHSSAQKEGLTRTLADLQTQEQQLLLHRRRYFEWVEQGLMRPESVQERLDEAACELQQLATRTQGLQARLRLLPGVTDHLRLPSFADAWSHLTAQERKRLVQALISKVTVQGRTVLITWAQTLVDIVFTSQ